MAASLHTHLMHSNPFALRFHQVASECLSATPELLLVCIKVPMGSLRAPIGCFRAAVGCFRAPIGDYAYPIALRILLPCVPYCPAYLTALRTSLMLTLKNPC